MEFQDLNSLPPLPPKRRRRSNNQRTGMNALETWQRDYKCVQMRKAGHDWESICATLGYYDHSHASRRLMGFLKETVREDVDELRELEMQRLDEKILQLEDIILQGGNGAARAIEIWNKLSERRSKLMGLDRPEKKEVTVLTADTMDAAIAKLNTEMEMKAREAGVNLAELTE